MLLRTCTIAVLLLLHVAMQAQSSTARAEWEFNVEGGLDVRSAYQEIGNDFPALILRDEATQRGPAPFVGLSVMRRISGLRALYGLRLDGHAGTILDPGMGPEVRSRTATVMLNYRAFVFDMQGDCDCPTWGDDPWLKKALFVEVGLGVGYQVYSPSHTDQEPAFNVIGGAYLARLGLAHRLNKQVDVYLAGGIHGILADREAFRWNEFGLRPALGITYRPK